MSERLVAANPGDRNGRLVRFDLVAFRRRSSSDKHQSVMAAIAPLNDLALEILTDDATAFLHRLARKFEPRRRELLARRVARQHEIDRGQMPDFLTETVAIRAAEWKVAPIPADLQDRRVEITGP